MSVAPLSRPAESQVKLDQTPNLPHSDGFNWPTFRLLNKQTRVTLSPEFLDPSNVRRVLAIANANGGLFAATTSAGLIISPLSELRDAFNTSSDTVFAPKRTLPYNPVSIAFACNDTRLLAGTGTGEILVFDVAQLSSSSAQVDPIQVLQGSSSPASQILPNPSNEAELAQLVAIVRVDGMVQMLDIQMNPKGAWAGTDLESTPVAASWSPKGKQLAIGLRSGDILTVGLTNNSTPLKHIPATASSALVSLHWVGPAFTFRTSYEANAVDPPHHIVSLDSKANTAAFVQLVHPFPLADRPQNAQVLVLPRWDHDAGSPSAEEAKALIVVGDSSSTDIEVLGNTGPRWFQQSQENQLSIPLDKNDNDTFLLTLDVDLTGEMPIMYAYLNDGTIQGWYINHSDSKQYAGLVGAGQTSPASGQSIDNASFGQQQVNPPSTSPFLKPTTSAFGQSSGFGQSSTSAFGGQGAQSPPTFGQNQTASVFGQSAFGQQPAFGQSSFGAQSSAFNAPNTTTAFGGFANVNNAFNSSSGGAFDSSSNAPPSAPPLSSTPSVSMSDATPSFGGLSLGSSSSEDTKNKPIGGGMFGTPAPLPLPPNHPANQPSTPTPSNFSDPVLVKPASGFGAFGGATSGAFGNPKPTSAFGGGGAFSGGAFAGGGSNSSSGTTSSTPNSTASPAFGKTGFGQTGFGFGQTGFGQKPASGFGSQGTASAFSAFAASGPTSFGTGNSGHSAFGGGGTTAAPPASTTPTAPSSGGFGAFSSQGPSAFGATGSNTASVFGGGSSSSPASVFGTNTNANTPPTNSVASAFSGFAAPSNSLFGPKTPQPSETAQPDSISSSPEPSKAPRSPSPGDSPPPVSSPPQFTTSSPATSGNAFGNLKAASSGFKPASGFGAFGTAATPPSSPFFNAGQTAKTPPVSAFGSLSSTAPKPTASASPAFGALSQLGGQKSAFAPVSPASTPAATPPVTSGGFGAFSNSATSLTSSTTPAKSFGDLLKSGAEPQDKLKTASAFGFAPQADARSPSPAASVSIQQHAPVFTPPPKEQATEVKATSKEQSKPSQSLPTKDKDGDAKGTTSESSFGELSQSSSFVEVSGAEAEDDADGEAEDAESAPGDDDGDSFLSDSFGSGSEAPPDDDDGEDDSRSPSPSTVPLPPSRSPSSTPRAEVPPQIRVSESPTPSEEEEEDEGSDSSEGRLSTIREESTTPPGSPEKNPSPPTKTPLAAPIPVAPSPFGIGLGRPSTRPTRSSPLANAPVSGDEDAKQAQPTLKARPASPKSVFGVLPPQLKTESIEDKAEPGGKPPRPKTPPLSALSFGSSAPKAPPNVPKVPLAGVALPPFPSPSLVSPTSPSPLSPGSLFGFGTPKNVASPATPAAAPKGFFSLQPTKPASPVPVVVPPPPEATMEEGMQKECALLFANMTRELEDFRLLAQTANQKLAELKKAAGGSRRTADLGNKTKWSLSDAVQFGQTLRSYEQDLANLKEERSQKEALVRELQSNLLKAGTRREEIGRFIKAQHDNDFAKMLKARTLGPEHLETQTHLRRSVRAIRDRIQKLESHLQESKKRLSRANSGTPGLRAPTLDTLNRTFRNMDIALDNQTNDIERLTARVAKLDIKAGQRSNQPYSTRDARLPDIATRQRPLNVTPHVAVTTAAALNAERSAHKLKRALLSVRKEPLLNTQAASAPPAVQAFKTPQKTGINLGLGLNGSAPSTPPPPAMLDFDDFPEDNFNPSPILPTRRGAGGGSKTRISSSVPLRRSPAGQSTPSPPPSFDWGPLPTFQKPASTIRSPDLGGSWVTDGFGSKK
ncbi:hypothetical protein R3P38DRAFT_2919513 [Favolaschia claudopus]|uniref:Nucleoporin Nup159/Nup146 N-terminal domain-containing protein n=1 Tax=Favolaschia claudopus TaxID=2862362 RepID=A0AAW0C3Q4_9AGAR